jgi:hypothetical protein
MGVLHAKDHNCLNPVPVKAPIITIRNRLSRYEQQPVWMVEVY